MGQYQAINKSDYANHTSIVIIWKHLTLVKMWSGPKTPVANCYISARPFLFSPKLTENQNQTNTLWLGTMRTMFTSHTENLSPFPFIYKSL